MTGCFGNAINSYPFPTYIGPHMIRPALQAIDQKISRLPDNTQGAVFLLLATFCFGIATALIKLVGQRLHVTQIIGLRQFVIILALTPALFALRHQSWRLNRPKLQVLRSSLALIGILAGFTSVIYLPLAMATTIGFTRSFFVVLFAILILGETIGMRRSLAMITGFAGVLIVSNPGENFSISEEVLLGILAAAAVAMNVILIRIQSRNEIPALMVAYQALLVGLALIIPMIYFWIPPTMEELAMIGIIGLMSVIAQWGMVRGFKAGEAAAMAPLDYMRLVYAILWGWFLFGEWPELNVWLGAGLIFASTLYIVHRDAKLNKQKLQDNKKSASISEG